MGQSSLSKVQ